MKTKFLAPLEGKIIQIDQVSDPVFSQKMLGDGIAIRPTLSKHKVLSPIDGTIQSLHSSNHAYGILSTSGVEILIHIGVDTVNLKGQGFNSFVKEGQVVKAGEPLVEVDFDYLSKNAPSVDVIMVLTALLGSEVVLKNQGDNVKSQEEIISVE